MKPFIILICLFCASCMFEPGEPYMKPRQTEATGAIVVISASPTPVSITPRQADGLIPMRQQEEKPKVTERRIMARVTAYCPCTRCTPGTGRTSTRTSAWRPGIAVAPLAIPYGSLIHVPGYDRAEWAKADDTGGAMRKAWRNGKILLDVRFDYHWQAVQWGDQYLEVIIRSPGAEEE